MGDLRQHRKNPPHQKSRFTHQPVDERQPPEHTDTLSMSQSTTQHPNLMMKPADILKLQSTIGNQAVLRMLNQGQKSETTTIQRMPTRNQALTQGGTPSGGARESTKRYLTFLTALDTLDQYVQATNLSNNRQGILDQFMHLKELYDDIGTTAHTFYDNLSIFKKNSKRGKYVNGLFPQILAEQAQLVPIMLRMLDNIGKFTGQPKLFIILSSNRNVGQTTELNITERTGTAGGGMNQVGFYDEGVFKAPEMHLTDELLSGNNEGGAMQYGKSVGMTGTAAQNEYWIAGQDLGLKGTDSLANREVAMSYLDRLLGANMLVRTEKALERDGIDVREGIIMEYATGDKMGDWVDQHGNESVKTNVIMRDLSKLQLLDILALQIDRHKHNYMVQTDTDGNVKGLRGFDHDMSFGRRDDWVQGHTKEIPGLAKYVDRELAQRIVDLDPQMLAWVMQGLLEPDVIGHLLIRLDKLKTHLRDNQNKWLLPNQWEQAMNNEDFGEDKSYINTF